MVDPCESMPPAEDSGSEILRCVLLAGDLGAMTTLRREVRNWATRAGLREPALSDIVLCVYEALANASEHAYPEGAGPIVLTAEFDAAAGLTVVVTDEGRWRDRASRSTSRGRGLTLIRALTDRTDVRRGETGTAVLMHWSRSARISS